MLLLVPWLRTYAAIVLSLALTLAVRMSSLAEETRVPIPICPKCDRPMVRRTARRGANAGSEFWGCSEFPRCRGIVQDQPPVDAPADKGASAPDQGVRDNAEEATAPDAGDKPRGFLTKVARAVDKGHRWYLERDEPDAAGRWDDAHRRGILRYVYDRDGGRCGICTAEMKIKRPDRARGVQSVRPVRRRQGRQGRAGHPIQEPPAQDRQPPGRPHLLQQTQAQHPRSRRVEVSMATDGPAELSKAFDPPVFARIEAAPKYV